MKLNYNYKDENYNNEWQIQASPNETILDLINLNPDSINNGLWCTFTLFQNDLVEYEFEIIGTWDWENDITDIIQCQTIHLTIFKYGINFENKTQKEINLFVNTLENNLNKIKKLILSEIENKFKIKTTQDLEIFDMIDRLEIEIDYVKKSDVSIICCCNVNLADWTELTELNWINWKDLFKIIDIHIDDTFKCQSLI